jgi:phosphoribosylanthranilate isomerase
MNPHPTLLRYRTIHISEVEMKVKICGIKTYDEALASVEAGADMLGFNFYLPSPRYISPSECLRLQVKLQSSLQDFRQHVRMIGVFVNSTPDEVSRIFGDCNLDLVQLSGDETPAMVDAFGERAFKALRPVSAQDLLKAVSAYPRRGGPPAWLIDSYRAGAYGGTGEIADWRLARQVSDYAPILLAGGLNAANVAEAIRQVRPWGVDVASGVESQPGVKDARKIMDFIRAARSVQLDTAGETR